MHVVIINGSPRVEKHSNTNKIIDAFGKGLTDSGVTYEKYAISRRESWDDIRDAYMKNSEIVLALPLYVECVPGLLLEFLETLPQKNGDTRISYILQSGFAEGAQLRCGEAFLIKLTKQLRLTYGGTLVKGDNFGIRVMDAAVAEKMVSPYTAMGVAYVDNHGFDSDAARKFTGPETFKLPARIMLGLMFKTAAKRMFDKVARSWGCTVPLDYRP